MTELEKYKKALQLACEHAWEIDCGCHLPCQTQNCWERQSCAECLQKYFLQQAEQSDTKPITNKRWLESLSDEDLARTFIRFANRANALCEMCEYRYVDCSAYDKYATCTDGVAEWLQAEHKESEQ